jgi:hypothetical protein
MFNNNVERRVVQAIVGAHAYESIKRRSKYLKGEVRASVNVLNYGL